MQVQKSSGQTEPFKKDKYYQSLARAGATPELVSEVFQTIEPELHSGISTETISEQTAKALARRDMSISARYNLRRGLAKLGPAGFIFEQYIEALLRADGYETKRNVHLRGRCVSHEVDVVAEKNITRYLLEMKYHNSPHIKTHVDVVMYAYARLLDIAAVEDAKNISGATDKMWVITNTKFTSTAIEYGACQGLRLTGWSYPSGESLEQMILRNNVFPVSVLPSVGPAVLVALARAGVMLVSDLCRFTPAHLQKELTISSKLADIIMEEASGTCHT